MILHPIFLAENPTGRETREEAPTIVNQRRITVTTEYGREQILVLIIVVYTTEVRENTILRMFRVNITLVFTCICQSKVTEIICWSTTTCCINLFILSVECFHTKHDVQTMVTGNGCIIVGNHIVCLAERTEELSTGRTSCIHRSVCIGLIVLSEPFIQFFRIVPVTCSLDTQALHRSDFERLNHRKLVTLVVFCPLLVLE